MRRDDEILLVLLVVFVAGCFGCDEDEDAPTDSMIRILNQSERDTVTALIPGDTADIVISSETGIGEATVVLLRDHTDRSIRFLFQYTDGRPFQRLESFRFTGKHVGFQTFLGHSDSLNIEIANHDNMAGAVRAHVPVRNMEDGVSVTIPGGLLREYPDTVIVSWVDMYR